MPRMIPSARPVARPVLRRAFGHALGRLAAGALLSAVPLAALAELPAPPTGPLVPAVEPEPRPYPWAVLDQRPGDDALHVQSLIEERMMIELVPERTGLRVQSPEGLEVEVTYADRLLTRGVTPAVLRGTEPYAQARVALATPVSDGRVLSISRVLRQPTAELPAPAALRAQIEGLYGPPSRAEMDGPSMRLTWAWGTEGFIPDLDAAPEIEARYVDTTGAARTQTFRACEPRYAELDYRFEPISTVPLMPGCVASYSVSFRGGAELTTIGFTLTDWELVRRDRAEADRQVRALLSSGAPVAPSDLDL